MYLKPADKVHCSCGGIYVEEEPTVEEEGLYGCGRPGCCVGAMRCDKCKTRVLFEFDAPEDIDY